MDRPGTRGLMVFACLSIALATALAAVGSHALAGRLEAAALRSYETAVQFQFLHSLGLIGLCVYRERRAAARLGLVALALLTGGLVLFCGGLYASSLGGPRVLAALAPSGGVALIVGWLLAAVDAARPPGPGRAGG